MKTYCLVDDNRIVRGPVLLPKSWNNISNFNMLDDITLKSYGWVPHIFVETAIPGQIIEGSTFEIFDDKVVETQISRNKTPEEQEEFLNQQWNCIRKERNYALYLCDWTQLNDNGISSEKKDEWATYRQKLRDLTSQFSNPENVEYPVDPNGNIFDPRSVPTNFLFL